MQSEVLLDVETLLAPLPRGLTGADPELYLLLKDWRAEARAAEREALQSGDAETSPSQAGVRRWREVVDGGARLLGETAKDLEVAGWVCEGLLRLDGFPGLAQGFELMAGLIETFWDDGLRPEPDEDGDGDGDETRLTPLFGLLGRGGPGALLQPLKLAPLSDVVGDEAPVGLGTVEIAFAPPARSDDPDTRERLLASHAERVQAVIGAIARASPEFVRRSALGIETSLAMLDRLMTAVEARTDVGRFGSQVAEPLASALRALQDHAPAAFATAAAAEGSDAEPGTGDATDAAGFGADPATTGAPGGALSHRGQAFEMLERVAAFFERTEPQSMVAQSLRDVLRRAKLPLNELLAELLPDSEQRGLFLQRAGIREEPAPSSDDY